MRALFATQFLIEANISQVSQACEIKFINTTVIESTLSFNYRTNMAKQNILLAITGLAPQVVTETIYAIYMAGKPLPDKVVIITTQIGKDKVKKYLIDNGIIKKLCDDYQIPSITLRQQDICIIPDDNGNIIDDINAQEQMNDLADFICNKVQELTIDSTNIIHASLAGGRKTMTFFLGMAMSLYGRKGDVLSHVLINKGYESSDFFYPTPSSFNIKTNEGKIIDAKDAKVFLTEIPFVRLRGGFPQDLLNGITSYSQKVKWLNLDLKKRNLRININKHTIKYCKREFKLSPAEFMFYLWFCLRAKSGKEGLIIPYDGVPDKNYAKEYLQHCAKFIDGFKLEEITIKLKHGMDKDYFEQRKTKINSAIKKIHEDEHSKMININRTKQVKGKYQFAITLAPNRIIIKEN